MNVKDITSLLKTDLKKIMTPSHYKNIVNMGSNLFNYDIINRVLIEIQNEKAFELKTDDEWRLDSREIIKGEKPIYVILHKYENKYIDSETREEIGENDLNSIEVTKALEYGIVERVETFSRDYLVPVYDIRQTVNIDSNDKYEINKPILKISKVLELIAKVTGCKCIECESTYYSKSDNTLYISKMNYQDIVNTVSEILAQFSIDSYTEDFLGDAKEFVNGNLSINEKDIIKNTIQYEICTVLSGKCDVDFSPICSINENRLLELLIIADSLAKQILDKVEFNRNDIKLNASDKIARIKRAGHIICLVQASEIEDELRR